MPIAQPLLKCGRLKSEIKANAHIRRCATTFWRKGRQ